ncbi:glycosyltransferase family 4 protein [Caldibacillus lycopersici]|uniref:Glycosyltransferase family 4 protein n=1 Tax=Perspicuibacillus lycopersici TaxID=1325689 RepID=A0AAE3IRP8_9BACI|nr:glycosyltransferase family 1 protein [Perspicuibacillus lycopersici]MCU9613192.1 glycosyltransferase family 4 protein [Perspicuibacillus lycopersici]
MNIVINAVLSYELPRGVGRYFNNLLPAIAEIDKENQYYVFYGKWMKEYDFLKIKQHNIHFIELDIKNSQLTRNFYLSIIFPLKCKKYNPDVLFLIDTQAIIIKPCKLVSTIHDLAEYVIPEKYSKKQAFIRRLIVKHQAKVSDKIITVSQYSKDDICNRFNISENRVAVIYNSVDTPETRDICQPENYFLFVSETERAKNLMGLLKAFSQLPTFIRDKFMIYVVGKKGNDYGNIIQEIKDKDIESKVKFFGYVSDEELMNLYAKAYAFIFPSLFEGFGLPILEAMSKGTPVLCSNTSSMPEVGGDAVITFDPYEPADLAQKILKIVQTPELRIEMINTGMERARKFNKDSVAKETLKVILGD